MKGKHRELSEIDEADILSIALDMDVGLEDWECALRQVVNGITSYDPCQGAGVGEAASRILENAMSRIVVLQRYCG